MKDVLLNDTASGKKVKGLASQGVPLSAALLVPEDVPRDAGQPLRG